MRHPTATALQRTALIVHGGFWRPSYDRAHAAEQSAAFAAAGYHVATLEYRRTPGEWPQMSADILDGLMAVRANPNLPESAALVGHSAGGHLVTWAAYQAEARGLVAAVSLAGCVDLHLVRDLGLGDGAAAAMMGAANEQVWRAADPAMLGAPPVPVRLVHGGADETVPVEISESYQAAAGAGIPLQVLGGVDHMALIDPRTRAFSQVLHTVDEAFADRPAR